MSAADSAAKTVAREALASADRIRHPDRDERLDTIAEQIAAELYNTRTVPYAGAVLGARAALQAIRDGVPETRQACCL